MYESYCNGIKFIANLKKNFIENGLLPEDLIINLGLIFVLADSHGLFRSVLVPGKREKSYRNRIRSREGHRNNKTTKVCHRRRNAILVLKEKFFVAFCLEIIKNTDEQQFEFSPRFDRTFSLLNRNNSGS